MSSQTQPICVTCGLPGCDVRFKSCPNNCAYHARCIDLLSIRQKAASNALGTLSTCPTCGLSCTGIEMIPLSFVEIDSAQRLSGFNKKPSSGSGGGAPSSSPSNGPNKRTHSDVMMDVTSTDTKSQNTTTSFYDPANPRTGKWSDEEIAFRDSLVPLFVDGSLPLTSGLKLIDFLSSMLKSKPSRLTKKMKHAKLSTRHFRLDSGYIRDTNRASEVSRLESAFVNSISDPVERSEIKFHMQKEWRDHLAERFTFLRISFHAEEWLKSVDVMDRRITLAKSRNRMVKRRFMMGKAMEKDTSSPTPGIFIDSTVDNGAQDDEVDFELLASALETNDAEDADLRALYSSMADGSSTPQIGSADGPSVMPTPNIMGPMNMMGGNSEGGQGCVLDESGHSRRLSKTSGVSGKTSDTSSNGAAEAPFRSALLPSLGSAEGPNFRFAAPFLAKVTAYIEHNRVPFEHVDIWVPSSSNGFNLDPTGATAPEPTVLGSGSAGNNNSNSSIAAVSTQCPVGRLCFAGSASVGVQIVDDAELKQEDHGIQPFDHKMYGQNHKAVPLSSDEIYHLSLFGSYSEKFSFSSGCGLPGRVYESAVPAWEQFIANAPSHLFERRGGAMQFGIKTALGLPIRSPNVGRIVLVLYSKHNREKNDELVGQMVRDFQVLNPSPRWKLMVDMGNNYTAQPTNDTNDTVMGEANVNGAGQAMGGLSAAMAGLSEKNVQISDVISMLGENMPSDPSTLLGQQIHNIMSLRMVLLKKNRNVEEENLVDSILTLFDSYVKAERSRPDITLMLARDFAFTVQHQSLQQMQQQQMQNAMQRQMSIPTGMHMSIGSSFQQQPQESIQLDYTHHGQMQTNQPMSRSVSAMEMSVGQSTGGLSSLMGPDPTSASLGHLDNIKQHAGSLNGEPPMSLNKPPESLN